MEIDLNRGQQYAKRISHKPVRIFYFLCSLFLLIAAILPIAVGEEAYIASAAIGGFALFLFLLLYSQTSAWSVLYFVGEEGIYLKRSWFKNKIAFSEISTIKIVNEEEAKKILYNVDEKRVASINSGDIGSAFKNQIAFGRTTMYSSVPILTSETRGMSYRIRSHSLSTEGDFVFIFLKDDRIFAITPSDCSDFMEGVKFYGKGYIKEIKSNGEIEF
jgi:hypothetical protein